MGARWRTLTRERAQANFLCHLLYTGALFQLKVKVVGFRGAAPDDVLFEKIPVTLDELRQHDPDDIVMFVDAYDVLLVGGSTRRVLTRRPTAGCAFARWIPRPTSLTSSWP